MLADGVRRDDNGRVSQALEKRKEADAAARAMQAR